MLTVQVKFELFTLRLMVIATVLIKKLFENEEGQFKNTVHIKIIIIKKSINKYKRYIYVYMHIPTSPFIILTLANHQQQGSFSFALE